MAKNNPKNNAIKFMESGNSSKKTAHSEINEWFSQNNDPDIRFVGHVENTNKFTFTITYNHSHLIEMVYPKSYPQSTIGHRCIEKGPTNIPRLQFVIQANTQFKNKRLSINRILNHLATGFKNYKNYKNLNKSTNDKNNESNGKIIFKNNDSPVIDFWKEQLPNTNESRTNNCIKIEDEKVEMISLEPKNKSLMSDIDIIDKILKSETDTLKTYNKENSFMEEDDRESDEEIYDLNKITLAKVPDTNSYAEPIKNIIIKKNQIQNFNNSPKSISIKLSKNMSTYVQNDALANVSNDIPSDAPNDIPSDAPNDIPSDAPNDIQMTVPNDIQMTVPNDIPTDVSKDIPVDVPNDIQMTVPNDIQMTVPNDIQMTVPNDIQMIVPNDIQMIVPNDIQMDVPNDIQMTVPNDIQMTVPNDIQTDVSNDIPVNLSNDIPVNVSNDIPTDVSNDIPTDIWNDIPNINDDFIKEQFYRIYSMYPNLDDDKIVNIILIKWFEHINQNNLGQKQTIIVPKNELNNKNTDKNILKQEEMDEDDFIDKHFNEIASKHPEMDEETVIEILQKKWQKQNNIGSNDETTEDDIDEEGSMDDEVIAKNITPNDKKFDEQIDEIGSKDVDDQLSSETQRDNLISTFDDSKLSSEELSNVQVDEIIPSQKLSNDYVFDWFCITICIRNLCKCNFI